jgi:methionyl-tRNA synthetase
MTDPFYITTPIYYVNAKPHLGHAYTTIIADIANRFFSMKGADTFLLTGTDEHGDKIVEAAKKENLTPKAYVDEISRLYQELWPKLDINFNYFVRTTDKDHMEMVGKILQRIYDAGDIYFSEYEGMYCIGCERFYTKRELVEGKCPDHETKPEIVKESNYFFRMSNYQDWLIDHIKNNPAFIRPERYRNEALSFLSQPLEDLCISRPKLRLDWGIPLPFDDKYVTYVWFDALLNYVSALGYPDGALFKKFWPYAQHLVAKDILKPHGIYWPIMLKAAGIPLYRHLNVHGYWNIEHSKMSKSLGNVVDPIMMKDTFSLDAFRYFLAREMTFGLDSKFSETAIVQRINADLANDLGNLFSRVLSMAGKYFKGVVPEADSDMEAQLSLGLKKEAMDTVLGFEKEMEEFAFHRALEKVWKFISTLNKYIDEKAPWLLAKDEKDHKKLATVMYNLLESLRVVSGLIYPVMPETAKTMQKHLGFKTESNTVKSDATASGTKKIFYDFALLKTWNVLQTGTTFLKPVALFPRIDINEQDGEKKETKTKSIAPKIKPEITMEEFSKVDLRVATIIKAEAIPKAKKLLKLEVDLGEKRTIVAGVSASYKPDELVGKQVVIVANLKPAKLMGVLSKGMLLAATQDKELSVVTVDRKVKSGTSLS